MFYNLRMPHDETTRWDRYTLSVYCQHCGQYLTTVAYVEREKVPKVRAELHALAQQHANECGRGTEVTFRVTQQRRVWFTPEGTA